MHLERLTHKLRNDVRNLRHRGDRDEQQLFVAEGEHLCMELLSAGILPRFVVLRSDAGQQTIDLINPWLNSQVELYQCNTTDMDMMSDAVAPQPILAVVPYLQSRDVGSKVLALDSVSDPGNVGTIIRCAAWFGLTDVILGEGCADLYNPKTMRSTAGAAFHINIVRGTELTTALPTLSNRPIIAAVAVGGQSPSILRTLEEFVIVVGSEAHGVSEQVGALCSHRVTIPGGNNTESLNAAIAAAILCYEAGGKQ